MRWISKEAALADLATRRSDGCPACAMVREATPIAASPHAIAILDRYASRPGDVLIILRRHAEHIARLPWDEYAGLQQLTWQIAGALDRVLGPRRIYIAALGSAQPLATSFPHVHLHVIPLSDGGEADRPASVLTWNHGMYVFEDDAEEAALRARLTAAIDSRGT